jgi:alkanesulfonate monooxygenase SsuD/methylene tetrahydromethanopterin reductase-like flavin-dependent oxidoreductase (luciferase family)
MRFGLFGGPIATSGSAGDHRTAYENYVQYVIDADRLGFASALVTEHHFTGVGQATAPFMLLAHLAARTSRIRLGTGITVLPWYGPMAALEQAATLDVLSDGRFDFGVGKGFRANEYDGFCMPQEDIGPRYEEAVDIIQTALAAEARWSYQGRFWSFEDVLVEPAWVQEPNPPLWVGAGSPDTLRRAVDMGFRILMDQIGSFDKTAERIAIVRARQEELGIEPTPYDIGVTRSLDLVRDEAEREQAIVARVQTIGKVGQLATKGDAAKNRMAAAFTSDIREATEEGGIIGTPEECVQRLEHLRSLGADYVLISDSSNSRTTLDRFAKEVIPQVNATEIAAAADGRSVGTAV